MVNYKCSACDKELVKEELRRRLACPYCGTKVIFKKRPDMKKVVEAR